MMSIIINLTGENDENFNDTTWKWDYDRYG